MAQLRLEYVFGSYKLKPTEAILRRNGRPCFAVVIIRRYCAYIQKYTDPLTCFARTWPPENLRRRLSVRRFGVTADLNATTPLWSLNVVSNYSGFRLNLPQSRLARADMGSRQMPASDIKLNSTFEWSIVCGAGRSGFSRQKSWIN